jgi:hypothetical protein
MMNLALGLNEEVLKQCSVAEQASYRMASRLFLFAMFISILGNASFGWLMLRHAAGTVLLALLMSFIHSSVLRISFITLLSRPLTEDEPTASNPLSPGNGLRAFFKNPLLRPVSLLRIVFVGCIAVSVSLPLSTMFFYNDAIQAEQEYRDAFERSHSSLQDTGSTLIQDFRDSHYPFVIMKKVFQKPSCKGLFLLFCLSFFAPLFILARLRHGEHFKYTRLLKASMLQVVMVDYDETMEQSQHFVDRKYPEYHLSLKGLNAFADGPLRHRLKRDAKISFGDKKAFDDFLNSR